MQTECNATPFEFKAVERRAVVAGFDEAPRREVSQDRFPDAPEGRSAATDLRRRMTAFGIGRSVPRWLGRVGMSHRPPTP
jgi:hypothetical protein